MKMYTINGQAKKMSLSFLTALGGWKMLKRKDILGIKELSSEEILYILEESKAMKEVVESGKKKTTHLTGKTVINLFYENSTRTRVSFELAAKYMGANAVNMSSSGSSVKKGETLLDTGKNLEVMGADVIVLRHSSSGSSHLLAKNLDCSIINGGDGMNEHPTQALLDMKTIQDYKGGFEGLEVAIVGDIYHSRVARSDIYALNKLGANVRIFSPSTLLPVGADKLGVKVCEDVREAIAGVDVIMGLRMQLERQKSGLFPSVSEYFRNFGLADKHLKLAKEDVIVMHPGPVNRGVEMSTSVIDHNKSVILPQVTNGVAVRMACLDILSNKIGG